jgi:pimeloyl-ACP methyl ester carboxylesterase
MQALDAHTCYGGLTPQTGAVEAAGVRLTYLEWGSSGPPLLLLHGITSDAHAWWRLGPALVAAGYHVFALDMPGHGDSAETDDHRIEPIAALVATVLRSRASDPAVVIGHSWGGAVALTLATMPDAPPLRQVVLLDPALRMSREWGSAALPDFIQGVGEPADTLADWLEQLHPDWHACDRFWKLRAYERCRPAAVRGFFTQSGDWTLVPRLAALRVPLLLLLADPAASVVAPEVLDEVRQTLPAALGQIEVIPGSDHNIQRGSYERVLPLLTSWLVQTDTTT